MPCLCDIPCPLLQWIWGCLTEFPGHTQGLMSNLAFSLLPILYALAHLPFCLHGTEKLQFLMCKKTTASRAPAVPFPRAVTAGPMQATRTRPAMFGDRASGRNGILPVSKLQDQDRSAEGAPNLWSGGEILGWSF